MAGHPFFGTRGILECLSTMEGWSEGWIELQPGAAHRDLETNLVAWLVQTKPQVHFSDVEAGCRKCCPRCSMVDASGALKLVEVVWRSTKPEPRGIWAKDVTEEGYVCVQNGEHCFSCRTLRRYDRRINEHVMKSRVRALLAEGSKAGVDHCWFELIETIRDFFLARVVESGKRLMRIFPVAGIEVGVRVLDEVQRELRNPRQYQNTFVPCTRLTRSLGSVAAWMMAVNDQGSELRAPTTLVEAMEMARLVGQECVRDNGASDARHGLYRPNLSTLPFLLAPRPLPTNPPAPPHATD